MTDAASIRVTVRSGRCDVRGKNHFSGFGAVQTARGRTVTMLGAPRWMHAPPAGGASDCAIGVNAENASAAALVDRLLAEPDVRHWGDLLNGSFLLVVHDPSAGHVTIITDPGNAFHCYECIADDRSHAIFGTVIDDVAHAAGRSRAVDVVSLAEYLVNTSMAYPATAYVGVRETPDAAWTTIGYRGRITIDRGQYWRPTCGARCDATFDELARMLREGLLDAVRAHVQDASRVCLFLSGGMDSRTLAGILALLGVRGTALTMADAPNAETMIAARVARAYGFTHEVWLRDTEYYPNLMDDFIALEGPHATFTRATHYGFRDRIRARTYDAVIGGYMSDTLLKLHEANVEGARWFGRHLGPLERFSTTPVDDIRGGDRYLTGYSSIIRGDVLDAIRVRRRAVLASWEDLRRDGSAWEWSWIWPFMRSQHNPNLTTNIGAYRAFEVFTDRRVLAVARMAPQQWKLNGRLFNRAVAPFLRPVARIPLARTRMRWFQPQWVYEAAVAGWHLLPRRWTFRDAVRSASVTSPASHSSWPNLAHLWETSMSLQRARDAFASEDLERALFASRTYGSFDARRYAGLPAARVRHCMYTMVHFDRWNQLRRAYGKS